MKIVYLLPILLGLGGVVQAGVNRLISDRVGLAHAVLLNTLVLLGSALLFRLFAGGSSDGFKEFKLWWLVPGLIGFSLVAGGPWVISRIGAVQAFVFIISAQLLGSLIWDLKVEHLPVSRERWIGVALVWVGVLLTTFR